jgi:hypothetical protein
VKASLPETPGLSKMAEKPPAWLRNTYQGPKRVLAEMRAFQKHLGTKV